MKDWENISHQSRLVNFRKESYLNHYLYSSLIPGTLHSGKFSGIPCPDCNSWRVKDSAGDFTNLICIDCDHCFKEKTVSKCTYCQIPLYKEKLIHIIKTGRCEDCNTEISLPNELIEYARS